MSEEQTDACSSVFRTGRADWIIDEFKQDILVHCGVGMASFSDSRRWMISSMIFSLLLDGPVRDYFFILSDYDFLLNPDSLEV